MLLQCGATENPKYEGSTAAKIAQMYIVDILFNEYSSRNVMDVIQKRQKTVAATADRIISD